jgi:hypothetical protein
MIFPSDRRFRKTCIKILETTSAQGLGRFAKTSTAIISDGAQKAMVRRSDKIEKGIIHMGKAERSSAFPFHFSLSWFRI